MPPRTFHGEVEIFHWIVERPSRFSILTSDWPRLVALSGLAAVRRPLI